MKRLLVVLMCILLAASASAEGVFMPGQPHASHLDFRQYFETMTAQVDVCTIAVAATTYDEVNAAMLRQQISADLLALGKLTELQPHTVYIVEKLPAGMQRIGSAIYVSAENVQDGSYRPWLALAACGVQEQWQGFALAGIALGQQADVSALAAWYADDGHDDMLSLFPAYFVEAFATAEELRMARETALALGAYVAEQDSVQALLSTDASDYIQPLLAALGIDRTYADPYAGVLDEYTYTHNQFYALIATSPKGDVFKMNPIEFDMSTPAQARRTLAELELAVDAMLAGVQQDAPDYYPVLTGHYAAPITYEFNGERGSSSVCYHADRRIVLGRASSIIHETAHMMTPCKVGRISRAMEQWKVEALAEYLSTTYCTSISEQEMALKIIYEGEPWPSETDEERAFWKKWAEVYLRYAPMPEKARDVQLKQWYRANLLAAWELNEEVYTVSSTYGKTGSAQLDEINGNELSYTEAEWLATHLIDQHGLEAFLRYCMEENVTFQDAFGTTYEEAKADWMNNRHMLD